MGTGDSLRGMNQRCTEGSGDPKRNALRAVSVCYKMHNRAASYGWIFRKNGKNSRKTGASTFFLLAGTARKEWLRFLRDFSV